MPFNPGHVVVLLIVIVLAVPALIQVWWRSGLPVPRSQHAARRRSGPHARPIVVRSARRP
mgnify:FL=1